MTCSQKCNQGRDCVCSKAREIPRTIDDPLGLDWFMRLAWTGMAWLGFFGMLTLIALVWGAMG